MGIFDNAVASLQSACGLQLLRSEEDEHGVRFMCRMRDFNRFLTIMKPALRLEGASVDLGKVYFLKEGEWAYLYRVSVSGDVAAVAGAIVSATVNTEARAVLTGPVLGGRNHWGQNAKGAGVMPMGQAKLGRGLL